MALSKTVLKSRLEEAVSSSNLGSKIWCGQTYNDVFTGETLINTLVADSTIFPSRNSAVEYAQSLLDTKMITCITKRRKFDDTDRLYCINRKELENAVGDDSTNIVRTTPKGKTDNSPNLKTAQVKKEPLGKPNSQENINGMNSHQQSNHVTPTSKTTDSNGLRSTNLQRLLEKDAVQANRRSSSPNKTTPSSAKGNFVGVLKDKRSESPNERRLTANKIEVVLSQQEFEKQPQQSSSVILIEKPSLPPTETDGPKTAKNLKASPSPKTPDVAKSDIESKKSEDKQKVKKSLSPSLTALIEKDTKNSQREKKNVEVNGTSSPKTNENGPSKSGELSSSWEAFEMKLQSKVKKSAEKPGRGSPDTRGSLDTRGSISKNMQIVIEDSTNAGKELEKTVGTVSAETRDSEDWKAVSPEKIDTGMSSVPVGRRLSRENEGKAGKTSNEDSPVRLSVNGDQIIIPSVRSKKNSFLTGEENSDSNGGKTTSGRERGPSLSFNDDPKTVIIEDTIKQSNGIKTGHKISEKRERVPSFHLTEDTVIIENDIGPNNLCAETAVSRTPSQSSTNSRVSTCSERKGLSREVSSESAESKPRTASFGKPGIERGLTGSKIETSGRNGDTRGLNGVTRGVMAIGKQKSIEIEIPGSDKQLNSKDENLVNTNGRAMPRSLADLLARDETLPPESQSRVVSEQSSADNTNFYKDKLKELKKTTPYYASGPIKIGDRGNGSANQGKAGTTSPAYQGKVSNTGPDLQNGLDTVSDKTKVSESNSTDVNNNSEVKENLASNTKVFKSNSVESTSSQKSEFTVADGKQEYSGKVMRIPSGGTAIGHKPCTDQNKTHHEKPSPTYVMPRLNLGSHHSPLSQGSPTTVASSPLVNGESSPSEELERRLAEFEIHKRSYENKITELQLQVDYLRRQKNGQLDEIDSTMSISDVTSLYSPYSTPVVSPGNSTVTSPSPTPQATPRDSMVLGNNVLSPMSPTPPPPPALPFIPAPPLVPEKHVKPNKPVVNPKTEMKPLFWNRIIASNDSMPKDKGKCVWKTIKEPAIDTNEFEKLFSKKAPHRKLNRTKSLRDDKHFAHINGKKVAKLLDTNRSRAIGIKMSSLNCQLEDIRNAVYNMDTSVVDMESLQSIYDIYPKEEEIQIIEEHLKKEPAVPLDKPEEFMNQLRKMKHFKERLECWLFQDKFSEIIYGIERSLACITESSNVITTNSEIATLLGLILAYGNYMNGNTQRGQADGFYLDVLLKLRDVKAKDSDMNLLQYTVKQYLKQYERSLDKTKNESRLPSPVSLANAAQVSFDKLKEELLKISLLLDETEVQAKKILDVCSPAQRNPFENKMRTFQTTAKRKISEETEKMAKAEVAFLEAVEYFRWESSEKKETPQEFFGLWAKFVDEIKICVKLEKQQQQIAKKNFSKVEHLNQIREAATKFRKRRQSVDIIL
ncbi:formin-2-like isoform X1 [Paramuricea clavata]|uniref:Formin-2-like isoform X1 n=1 Tax=Paramuricea clavata TaxID=317549 RepID=A0A7D9DLK4_PARCT|nr:formin-2-like isoform X1 [Paramuricea clavata]